MEVVDKITTSSVEFKQVKTFSTNKLKNISADMVKTLDNTIISKL